MLLNLTKKIDKLCKYSENIVKYNQFRSGRIPHWDKIEVPTLKIWYICFKPNQINREEPYG